jgi:glyoxalase family protein
MISPGLSAKPGPG